MDLASLISAILVASIRLHFFDTTLHMNHVGPSVHPVDARLTKGQEMGWFEQDSTIIVVAPRAVELLDTSKDGVVNDVAARGARQPQPGPYAAFRCNECPPV